MIKRFFKKMFGNWWVPTSGSSYYFQGCWVPINRYTKIVLEPYRELADAQRRCDELNRNNSTEQSERKKI